jgi:hypothetical protein
MNCHCLETKCLGKCVNLKEVKPVKNRGNYTITSFIFYTAQIKVAAVGQREMKYIQMQIQTEF